MIGSQDLLPLCTMVTGCVALALGFLLLAREHNASPIGQRAGVGLLMFAILFTLVEACRCTVADRALDWRLSLFVCGLVVTWGYRVFGHFRRKRMQFDDRDLDTMARTLYGEIRGYPLADQAAVAWAIRNRATRTNMPFMAGPLMGLAGAVDRVCRFPWQFSCWNEDDPNRPLLLALTSDRMRPQLDLARQVLESAGPDPTNGADHYHTEAKPAWAPAWPPEWARHYARTAQVGPHIFYDSRRSRP